MLQVACYGDEALIDHFLFPDCVIMDLPYMCRRFEATPSRCRQVRQLFNCPFYLTPYALFSDQEIRVRLTRGVR